MIKKIITFLFLIVLIIGVIVGFVIIVKVYNNSKSKVQNVQSPMRVVSKKLNMQSYNGLQPTIEYPQIINMNNHNVQNKINDELYNQAVRILNSDYGSGTWEQIYSNFENNPEISQEQKDSAKSKVEVYYALKHVDKEVLSIQFRFFAMIAGMVKPYDVSEYFTFSLNTGDIYQLKDLFVSENYPDCLPVFVVINNIIKRQIKNTGGSQSYNFSTIKEMDQQFYITNDSLIICFDEGEIAPIGLGPQQFVITYKQLTDFSHPIKTIG